MGATRTDRREYPLKTSRKAVFLGYGALFLFGAGFFFRLGINPVGREFAVGVGGFSFLLFLLMVSFALRSRLTLDGDRMEVRSGVRTLAARREEIVGLRTIADQYGSRSRICLKGDRGDFNVSSAFTGNDDLKEWLKGLPDLDQRDAERITQQLDEQSSPRRDGGGSEGALERARAWAIGLSVGAGVVSVPVLFVKHPAVYGASLAVLALFIPVGIVLVHAYPLYFTIFKRKPDPRGDLGYLVLWPGVAMLLSNQFANDPTHLVDGMQLLYWVLFVLACFVASLFSIVWKSPARWAVLAGLLIFGGMSSVGLTNVVNTLPDHSKARVYRSQVIKRYASHGRNTTFYLRLTPWGPMTYWDDVSVPMSVYDRVNVGDMICTGLHPGFLHASWYTLTACPADLMMPAFPGS